MSMVRIESRLDRIEALMADFWEGMTRLERQSAETERQLQEYIRESREQQKREVEERRKLSRQLGDLSNRLGTIVEDIIAPSLRRMVEAEFDCGQLEFFGRNLEKYHPRTNRRREFDVVAAGSKAVLLNQTKAFARPEYVKEAVEFLQSGEFFAYFPEYAGRPLIPVFASLHIPEEVVTYCTRQGIYAVGMGDEVMDVLNLEAVRALRA